jgi:hypothetical protein
MATNTTQAVPSAVHSVQPAVKVLRCAIDFSDGATKLYGRDDPGRCRGAPRRGRRDDGLQLGHQQPDRRGRRRHDQRLCHDHVAAHQRRHCLRRDGGAVEVLSVGDGGHGDPGADAMHGHGGHDPATALSSSSMSRTSETRAPKPRSASERARAGPPWRAPFSSHNAICPSGRERPAKVPLKGYCHGFVPCT